MNIMTLSEDDDELGAYIYNSSHTAKMFRAAKAKEEIDDEGSKNPPTSSIHKNKAAEKVVQTKTIGKKRKVVDSSEEPQKRRVYKCSHDGCTNKAQEAKVCRMHGAKSYGTKCSHKGCTNWSRRGGVCIRHGAKGKVKICSHEGCTNQVVSNNVCVRHGAKRKGKHTCRHKGCTNQARGKEGVCVRHGAKVTKLDWRSMC